MTEEAFQEWEATAQVHLDEISMRNKAERSTYFSRNNAWSQLYSYLSKLSNDKCWYSEAPESSSEWEIEHYRPKSESKDIDSEIILEEGYWWLAYYWKNYRLAGSLVNRLRKDRFIKGSEVFGKGTFFPLHKDVGYVADEGDRECSCEIPLLLDPIEPEDTTLISFDENGEIFETYDKDSDEWLFTRANISIKYYGLDHTPISRGRKQVWKKCDEIVNTAQRHLGQYKSNLYYEILGKQCINKCYKDLIKLSMPDQPYSMVVYSFVKEKSSDDEFSWLKEVINVLG